MADTHGSCCHSGSVQYNTVILGIVATRRPFTLPCIHTIGLVVDANELGHERLSPSGAYPSETGFPQASDWLVGRFPLMIVAEVVGSSAYS